MVVEVNFLLRPQERIWKLHDQFCTCLPIAPHSLPVDSRDCGRIRSPKIRIKRSILKGTNINSGPGKKFFLEAGIFFPRKISAGHCDNNEHDHTSYSSWLTTPSIYFITKLKRNLQKQKPSTRSEKTSRVICYWRLFFVCFVSQSVVITGNISNLSGGLITRCLPELPYI